ncbi:Lrp/AsnC family transcriptional regulator [Candidatus Borrarchaeum sp.]|uniref:Lrp/AsnC family transcriptional regulator n=1 Tax=Candidatus Borrarchaeum sp. TaxID=2846742 RepID=UPI00257FF731|nr:Lrp/AsnC family transcriptional regulator [Candidatus Borrarchaeum sp.]
MVSTNGFTLDEKDLRILELLQEDSSRPIKTIASDEIVNLAIPTVHERIRKMKESGIIKKYTVILDEKKLGKDVTAFIEITLDFKAHEPDVAVPYEVANMKDVLEVFNLAGDADHLIKVKTENISTLEGMIRTINRIPGVGRTRSVIVLSTEKEDTTLSLT